MRKKNYKYFLSLFLLFFPLSALHLFSQEVSTIKIGQRSFFINDIEKITFISQNNDNWDIRFFLKNGEQTPVWEQTCYFVHTTTSLPEIESRHQALNYYPNPVIDNLQLSDDKSLGEILLYDIHGKLLRKYQTDNITVSLDLSDLKSGMYLLKTSFYSFKIIKK